MFSHWFAWMMVATFVCAIGLLVLGMANLAGPRDAEDSGNKSGRSTSLMFMRVGFCLALLVQIIIYVTYIKP